MYIKLLYKITKLLHQERVQNSSGIKSYHIHKVTKSIIKKTLRYIILC